MSDRTERKPDWWDKRPKTSEEAFDAALEELTSKYPTSHCVELEKAIRDHIGNRNRDDLKHGYCYVCDVSKETASYSTKESISANAYACLKKMGLPAPAWWDVQPPDERGMCKVFAVYGQKEAQPKFRIGQTFVTRGKHPRECKIVDIHRTYNLAGEQVMFRYVATHEFMGQTITDYDVPETTVAMGLV